MGKVCQLPSSYTTGVRKLATGDKIKHIISLNKIRDIFEFKHYGKPFNHVSSRLNIIYNKDIDISKIEWFLDILMQKSLIKTQRMCRVMDSRT